MSILSIYALLGLTTLVVFYFRVLKPARNLVKNKDGTYFEYPKVFHLIISVTVLLLWWSTLYRMLFKYKSTLSQVTELLEMDFELNL